VYDHSMYVHAYYKYATCVIILHIVEHIVLYSILYNIYIFQRTWHGRRRRRRSFGGSRSTVHRHHASYLPEAHRCGSRSASGCSTFRRKSRRCGGRSGAAGCRRVTRSTGSGRRRSWPDHNGSERRVGLRPHKDRQSAQG
jgi:hypothetical protein